MYAVQVLHGDKLWFVSPPTEKPVFDGNVTQMQVARVSPPARNPPCPQPSLLQQVPRNAPYLAQWLLQYAEHQLQANSSALHVRRHLLQQGGLLQFRQQPQALLTCMLQRGHVLYLPPHWWHATLNLHDYNFFTSYFIQEAAPQRQTPWT